MPLPSPLHPPVHPPISERTAWIFDMDGTLTESLHDFPAISRSLGLPPNEPILEALDRLAPADLAQKQKQLTDIEIEIAHQATPQPGAPELLTTLKAQGRRIGILTRNTKAIAHITLTACNLDHFFHPEDILGRSCCPPKPQPSGILQLLCQWSLTPTDAVMTGDHKFDLLTAHNANTAAVYLDPTGNFPWKDQADYSVKSLSELKRLAETPLS
ncbi:MAG: HAD family hydrolase [Cyanobacteria bacterium J06621_3]